METELDGEKDQRLEAAYRRGVHQAASKAYQIACHAREEGKSIEQIIEEIGLFEDHSRDWRMGHTEEQPF